MFTLALGFWVLFEQKKPITQRLPSSSCLSWWTKQRSLFFGMEPSWPGERDGNSLGHFVLFLGHVGCVPAPQGHSPSSSHWQVTPALWHWDQKQQFGTGFSTLLLTAFGTVFSQSAPFKLCFTSVFRQENLCIFRELISLGLPAHSQRAAAAAGRRNGRELVLYRSQTGLGGERS